ncbi:MAG TPA: hypothetical protein VMR06_13310 [Dokdonella sp.]|uniref:tetratricopeptide repeat protein n=1 Tax=Dokdonella sp. TaxID=2291710 RepID=UPI002B8C26E4|nr:hypothetical protein [Dokdonella sp.]HUD42962.1 hypothetical protein [Dokdonella sp.]
MTRALARAATMTLTMALLAAAAVHIVTAWRADALLATDPAGAARVRSDHPDALLALAHAELQRGDAGAAARTAQQLLARDPANGAGFAVLARALGDEGGSARQLERYRIAARRAPRDLSIRGWLVAHELQAGDFPAALEHIDALLTLPSRDRARLLEAIANLAADPAFADALAVRLGQRPRWRADLLRVASAMDAGAADPLFVALERNADLHASERRPWLDALLRQGRWGEAFARWAGSLPGPQQALPLLYNGAFASPPSNAGFDWRVRRVDGVVFERVADGDGSFARLRFLGSPVGRAGLEQPLLLAPGRYRLGLAARAADLRAEPGLEWSISCAGNGRRVASVRVPAGPRWETVAAAFDIPPDGCDGQWLRLVNPAAPGVAQRIRGELELRDLRIDRVEF